MKNRLNHRLILVLFLIIPLIQNGYSLSNPPFHEEGQTRNLQISVFDIDLSIENAFPGKKESAGISERAGDGIVIGARYDGLSSLDITF